MINYFQKGFNYSEDGPGNRLVIHLQGCNICCPCCSNPEGIENKNSILINEDTLLEEILSCKRLFFDGGGVTFTRGECLLQKENLKYLFKRLHEAKINIAIETNSTIRIDKEMYEYIDMIICDFKHYDTNKLKDILNCTVDEKKIIKEYSIHSKKLRIRTVLIKGFNDTLIDAKNYLNFIKEINNKNIEYEFLLYHEYGKQKYKNLNIEYKIKDGFVDESIREIFEDLFRENNIKIIRS